MLFVKLSEVAYMEASDKCVSLFTDKGTEFITDYSLVQLEEKLPAHFLRIHRSTLINTRFIAEMERYFNGR
jgi:DNA-binding LytR/AlgR family response regulator